MKFLCDVNIGLDTFNRLSANSECEFQTVVLLNPKMPDDAIIDFAFKNNYIIITADKDFGELVYKSMSKHTGVILLRDTLTVDEKVETILGIINQFPESIEGSFIVYKNGTIRIR